MNSLQIKYFMEVVRQETNFTKAARQLFISQPALSKQIAKLEEELGLSLFDTTQKRAVELTPAGKIFYEFFKNVNNNFQETLERAIGANEKPFGEIKIACVSGTDFSYIQHKVNEFSRKYTDIKLTFISVGFQALAYGIDREVYDMAITIGSHLSDRSDLILREIAQSSMIFLYSAYGELAAKNPQKPIDFKDEVLYVLSSEEAPVARNVNEETCRKYGFMPKIKMMPNLDSIILALESGKGFTLINNWTRIKDSPSFRYLDLGNPQKIVAVWKMGNKSLAMQKFIEECFD